MRRVPVPIDLLASAHQGALLPLPSAEAHYMTVVLRLTDSSPLELFSGDGTVARGILKTTDAGTAFLVETVEKSARGESPLHITLFQAIPKGKRWEWILEKVCELGVYQIVPLKTARSVVQIPDNRVDTKLPRWQKILASAARQSERTHIPHLSPPLTIQEALNAKAEGLQLVAHTRQEALSPLRILESAPGPHRSLGIWIGPEGGFTDQEFQTLLEAGAHPISLGPRILRADTAPLVAISLAQAAAGDL